MSLKGSIPVQGYFMTQPELKPRFPHSYVSLFQIIATSELVGPNLTQQMYL